MACTPTESGPTESGLSYSGITMSSKGAPPESGLNMLWRLVIQEPTALQWVSKDGRFQLLRTVQNGWTITDASGTSHFAVARTSSALHPATVRTGEWELASCLLSDSGTSSSDGSSEDLWVRSSTFVVGAEGPNTEEKPFNLKLDLGADYFLRLRSKAVVWYRHPSTGEVIHSGAKVAGVAKKLGKRYCPMCHQCFSANNFVSQHLKNMHRPPEPSPPTCLADGRGGVNLSWQISGDGATTESFMVQLSTDGGMTWSTAIEDTQSASPRAHLGNLDSNASYVCRVAALSVATHGPMSAPSSAFTVDALAVEARGTDVVHSTPPPLMESLRMSHGEKIASPPASPPMMALSPPLTTTLVTTATSPKLLANLPAQTTSLAPPALQPSVPSSPYDGAHSDMLVVDCKKKRGHSSTGRPEVQWDEPSYNSDDGLLEVSLETQVRIFEEWTRQMKAIGAFGDAVLKNFTVVDTQRARKAQKLATNA